MDTLYDGITALKTEMVRAAGFRLVRAEVSSDEYQPTSSCSPALSFRTTNNAARPRNIV